MLCNLWQLNTIFDITMIQIPQDKAHVNCHRRKNLDECMNLYKKVRDFILTYFS